MSLLAHGAYVKFLFKMVMIFHHDEASTHVGNRNTKLVTGHQVWNQTKMATIFSLVQSIWKLQTKIQNTKLSSSLGRAIQYLSKNRQHSNLCKKIKKPRLRSRWVIILDYDTETFDSNNDLNY